jgi:hypothetical protein
MMASCVSFSIEEEREQDFAAAAVASAAAVDHIEKKTSTFE